MHQHNLQATRTAAAMAHAAVAHFLDVYLNYRHHLDDSWSQAALRGANTFPLEGLHSEGRTGSVSRTTDQNWTPRKWVELCTKLQQIRDKRLAVASQGWKVSANPKPAVCPSRLAHHQSTTLHLQLLPKQPKLHS